MKETIWYLTDEIAEQLNNEHPEWDTPEQPTWEAEDFELWDYVPAPAILCAFSTAQKEWVRERDANECQFPVVVKEGTYKNCGRNDHLQVHHAIIPQRFGKEHGFDSDDLDVPENALTVCESHHNGVIHNDMLVAKLAYKKDKSSFSKAFDRRGEILEMGKKYWNDAYDYLFERIIKARNKLMKRPYPYSRHQVQKIANGGLKPLPSVKERDNL